MSCPDCFKGHVHDGASKGREIKLHGLNVYVSEPPADRTATGIIVMIPDAFGWSFINNRLVADNYAAKSSFKVYLPDFMNGHSAPVYMLHHLQAFTAPSTRFPAKAYHLLVMLRGFIPWAMANRMSRVAPVIKSFFGALRAAEGVDLPIGAAGFCWGGKHAILLSAAPTPAPAAPEGSGEGSPVDATPAAEPARPLIDAAFTAHPSYLDVPQDIEAIAVPVSFAIGDNDSQNSPEQAEAIRAIVEGKDARCRGEVRMYEGCGHGFALRADNSLNDVSRQAAEAEDQAVAWFQRWLVR